MVRQIYMENLLLLGHDMV